MKEYIIIGMIALVLTLSIFQSFQISSLKTDSKIVTPGGTIDMAGWTDDEKMMYEHHGTKPARLQSGQSNSMQSTGMVGGC